MYARKVAEYACTKRDRTHPQTRTIPPLIHWGTSTWTYPEWQGIVYHKPYTTKSIKTESLAEYAAFKPFSTVGTDNTFYTPPNPFVLEECARHLPAGFKCVSKVWEELTVQNFIEGVMQARAV